MKNILTLAVVSFTILLLGTTCNSESSGYTKTDSGMRYKFLVDNDSTQPQLGEILTIDMVYRAEDTVLFDSYEKGQPFEIDLKEPQYNGDIYECMSMLTLGDSASFILKADSFFLITAGAPSLPPSLDSASFLYFTMKLRKIQTPEEAREARLAELKVLEQKEIELIANYVTENNITILPDEDGLYFMSTKRGRSTKVDSGKIVIMNYSLKLLNGEVLFSTLDKGEPIDFEYGTRFDTEGFNKGIGRMRKDGKASFLVPSSLAFADRGAGGKVGPYTPLVYDIEIIDIKNKEEWQKEKIAIQEAEGSRLKAEEITTINKYLTDNQIRVIPTESGLYYIETKLGDGEIPISGDDVKVHYVLTTLTGDTIDSSYGRNEPLQFKIDAPGIITGWHEAIKLMRVGGKALWLIPSKLGYGPQGRQPIAPYTPLLFEVEFVEIVK